MGLDMYLNRKIYVGAQYEHNNVTGVVDIKVNGKPLDIDFNKIVYIEERVGYWRKANMIHQWFVNEVQKGDDNCQEYYVSFEKLEELKDLCLEILNTKNLKKRIKLAEKKLPPSEGFFFGGVEVDDYYFEQLQDTVDIISNLKSNSDYSYRSSW